MNKAAIIKRVGDKWYLYTRDGKKILGRHDSYEAALRQERAIQFHKHAQLTDHLLSKLELGVLRLGVFRYLGRLSDT